ncbi:MIX and LysM peptidoglycan-binding domain-containing protein [Salinivibrio proteolyticus]|uniref:MIX and LysM peptidoglycan-binding domain-containing protein n=1 Tax=Salinivibrio proteolyticus TaxID=334715 RepID=UPI0038CD4E28
MAYKLVRLTELMAYEFSQVEGDISSLSERDVSSIIPDGVSFSQFKEKLDSGEYVLLTDAPKQSAMVHDSVNKIWSVAPSTNTTLSPQAQSALSARANQSGNVAAGASGSGSANDSSQAATTNIEDTYVPEPVKPDRSDVPPALKYENCFEIAASDGTFRKAVGCTFQLAKTEQEGTIGQWQTKPTEHGTKYTAYAAFDEPKKLVAKISADTMGVSVPDHVVMKPEGSAVVREAFIPVTPSIQLGERLGLPTEGYYYHFNQKRLVQEYKLLGNGKWQFYATRSTHEKLNHDQGLNKHQSAILVYWKLGGKNVEDQHLVYLKEAITREELDNLDDEWLAENGVKLSISDLLAAPKQAVANRDDSPAESDSDKTRDSAQPLTHTVKFDPTTRQRESWPAIAAQYGLSAKQLLELNPHYHAEPMSLAVGDLLTVKGSQPQDIEKKSIYELPPESPKPFNHPLNTYYDYTERCLVDTSTVAINHKRLVPKEVTVVNIKKVSDVATEFELGFTQVEKTQPLDDYWQNLFSSDTSDDTQKLLTKYNAHLNNPVRQGEIVVVLTKEPSTEAQRSKLSALIEEATAASTELAKLTEEQVSTFNRHFELLDFYADEAMKKVSKDGLPSDLYAYASMGVGAVAVGIEQHLKNINNILLEINHLYVSQVAMASRVGGINYGSFVAERASLFQKLDGSFAALSRRSVKIPVYTQIKRNLKLSTRSVVHHADEIIAKGFVPNLGKRMANVAIGIGASRGVGYVGLLLGGASGVKNIYDACSVDGSGECGKVTTREVAGFFGGIYGGGFMGNAAVGATLLALGVVGVTSAPILAIASIGAFVAGGAVGGIAGSTIGKNVGDVIYIAYQWGQEQLEATQESY